MESNREEESEKFHSISNMIAGKLKNLESANQRLKEEKNSLQRQLNAVLHRLADGRIPEYNQIKKDQNFQRLESLIKKSLQNKEDQVSLKTDSINNQAPIAKIEYLGLRDSISDCNDMLSNNYSSLSDTYEDFCLKEANFTDEVRMSNVSTDKMDRFYDYPEKNKTLLSYPEIARSRMTLEDTVASDSHKNDSKISTPISIISNASSLNKDFLYQESETMISSYSSSSDENLFLSRFHELRREDDKIKQKISRYSSSLPTSLQTIDKTTNYFINNNINMRFKEGQKNKSKVNRLKELDSTTKIIRTSSPLHKPPTIKISRKQYQQIQDSLSSVTTNEHLTSKVQMHKLKPLTQEAGYSQNHKPMITDQEIMNNLLSNLYKTHPCVRIGKDHDFLNNFQNIPSFLTSDLTLYPDMAVFIKRPGFGELLRYHEIYANVKTKSFLVQRVLLAKDFYMIEFKNRELLSKKFCLNIMESSSDAASTIMKNSTSYEKYEKVHGENERESQSVLSLEYYTPPVEEPETKKNSIEDIPNPKENQTLARTVLFSGNISKLGSKFKIWHCFWCELTNSGLFFYTKKSKSSPSKCIEFNDIKSLFRPMNSNNALSLSTEKLNNQTRTPSKDRNVASSAPIKRRRQPMHHKNHHNMMTSSNVPFFEIIMNCGKIFTLKSNSLHETEQWLINIRQVLKRYQAERIIENFTGSVYMQGWLKRIKSGQSTKLYCKLYSHYLIYYRSEKDTNPIGYRSLIGSNLKIPNSNLKEQFLFDDKPESSFKLGRALRSFRMQNNDFSSNNIFSDGFSTSDSDSDICQNSWTDKSLTFSIWVPNKDPIYLVPPNFYEFEKWKNYLLRACYEKTDPNSNGQVESQSSIPSSPRQTPHQILLKHWRQLVRASYATNFFHSRNVLTEPVSRTTENNPNDLCGWRKISELLLIISYPYCDLTRETLSDLNSLPTCQYTPRDPRYQSTSISRKYTSLKKLSELCFERPELKDELFLQLMKQCNPGSSKLHANIAPSTNLPKRKVINNLFCSRRRSTESLNSTEKFIFSRTSSPDDGPLNRNDAFKPIKLAWECLSLIIPIFLPSPMILSFLEKFLSSFSLGGADKTGAPSVSSSLMFQDSPRISERVSTQLSFELSKYAAFCFEMMERVKAKGSRLMVPSGLEVAAISMRNPYTYSLPFSLPIHLPLPGLYEVISFDGTTRIYNIIDRIQEQLGLKYAVNEGLCICSIYCRIPSTKIVLGMDETMNLCDVISSYEQVISNLALLGDSKVNSNLELSFRIQSFSKRLLDVQLNKKILPLLTLLVRQYHLDYVQGDFYSPLRGVDMLDLSAYFLAMDRGHFNESRDANLLNDLKNLFPNLWLKNYASDNLNLQLRDILIERWLKLSMYMEKCCTDYEMLEGYYARGYLIYLKRICPQRFSCRLFPCRMLNYSLISDEKIVYISPCSDRINFVYLNTNSEMKSSKNMPNMKQIKSISLPFLISYGLQTNGLYMFVYRTLHLPQKSLRPNYKEFEQKVDKLTVLLSDLCSAKELTRTLRFLCNGKNNT